MRPEEIRTLLRRQPFTPFRIYVSDGGVFEVKHPEMAMLTQREILVAVPQGNDAAQIPSGHQIIALLHVTRLEPINASAEAPLDDACQLS
jgi:hypothetical protein